MEHANKIMSLEEKHLCAWEYLEDNNYDLGVQYLTELADSEFLPAIHNLAAFYYHGGYGFKKNIDKSLEFYEKAFLISKSRIILEELMYVKIEKVGKLKAFFSVIFRKNIFKTLMLSKE